MSLLMGKKEKRQLAYQGAIANETRNGLDLLNGEFKMLWSIRSALKHLLKSLEFSENGTWEGPSYVHKEHSSLPVNVLSD